MENKLIDPYGLLGVDSRASLSELKKNYYNLALICHPDKGGNDKDMNVVSLAYNYIKEHLENVKETTYEKLEDEFAEFCKGQERLKPPTFGQIYEETNDWINEFNKKFEEGLNMSGEMRQFIGNDDDISNNPYLNENNPLGGGYGEYMDISDYHNNSKSPYYDIANFVDEAEYDLAKTDNECVSYCLAQGESEPIYQEVPPFNPNETKRVKNEFKGEVILYEEPQYLPDTLTSFPLDGKEVLDYSGNLENLRMSDYKMAFSPPEENEEVEEKDYLKILNIRFKDYIL